MAKKSSRKRPCCICRKWFQPDVRQRNRQKTCGRSECKKELHRRNCHDWNNRNKEYFANNYLENKIEQIEQIEQKVVKENNKEPPDEPSPPIIAKVSLPTSPLVLPVEIIAKEYGLKSLIIIQYMVKQIITRYPCRDCREP
ncbi:MAG: hypothetical protein U9Q91_01490 [Candidatus Marinimicrobia bacterium]|nr:hypothetical protein [Candidatus Neomarinimicrobiota bacterium]